MTSRNTLVRSLHDIGLAAWFGGNLMGAIGLNGGAASAADRTERLTIASAGWARWAPVQIAALVAHGIGGVGLIVGNSGRLAVQNEGRTNTAIKLAVTAAALGSTLWSGLLGAKMAKKAIADGDGAKGTTEPDAGTSDELAAVQRQQRIAQWITPVLTGVLLVLSAQQGEQQRKSWLGRVFS